MSFFAPTIKELTLADKMLHWSKEKNRYEITANKKYLLNWATALFLIALLLLLFVSLPIMCFQVIVGCITLIIPLFFILAGIRFYYLSGNDDRKIALETTNKVIVYSANLAIPFKTIKQLSITETDIFLVKNKFRIKKMKGWQLQAEDHRSNKAPLIKTENEEKMNTVAREFARMMGVTYTKNK